MIISPQTSYATLLMLTHYHYSLASSIIEEMKSIKNEVEIQGLKCAYLHDSACYVQFLTWLDEKMSKVLRSWAPIFISWPTYSIPQTFFAIYPLSSYLIHHLIPSHAIPRSTTCPPGLPCHPQSPLAAPLLIVLRHQNSDSLLRITILSL